MRLTLTPVNSLSANVRLTCNGQSMIWSVRNASSMNEVDKSTSVLHLRSCDEECAEPVEAKVRGTIPKWVKGYLLRNGPGLRKVGKDRYQHLFDGLALIHQFEINNGAVQYRNKFLRSEAYKRNIKANRIVVSDFGTRAYPDPCKTLLSRYMSYFSFKQFTDNDAVSVYPIGDNLYASTESTFLRRIDPASVDSLEQVDMSKYVAVNTQTAHPHIEENGVVYNLGSNFSGKGTYNLIKIEPDRKNGTFSVSKLCSLPVRNPLYPSYYHSFCFTEDYVVFIEQPLVTSLPSVLLSHFTGGAYCKSLTWRPKYKNHFNVICKKTGKLIANNYISAPFAFFHTINAYQKDDHIVCDICCYEDGHIVKALFSETLAEIQEHAKKGKIHKTKYGQSLQSQARRYVIPLKKSTSKVKENLVTLESSHATAYAKDEKIWLNFEPLTPKATNMSEMPQINYQRYNGRPYTYFYSLTRREDFLAQLMKCNTKEKTCQIWSEEHNHPSEPIFIPRPSATEEDDGVVVSAVLSDKVENEGFLLVLDGKTFKELARAEFRTQSTITTDFHGIFWKTLNSVD